MGALVIADYNNNEPGTAVSYHYFRPIYPTIDSFFSFYARYVTQLIVRRLLTNPWLLVLLIGLLASEVDASNRGECLRVARTT